MEQTSQSNDSHLGLIAVKKELLNARQLGQCKEELARRLSEGETITLGEVMVGGGYLTGEQLRGMRGELRRRQCKIPGYEILQRIGRGSVGTVYLARQIAMDREVAIKVLHPELATSHEVVEAYMAEARAVARLNHPHIVSAIDVGDADGLFYFTMEYLPGGTFADMLERGGPLDVEDGMIYLYQVVLALEHAWEKNIIHCDLKPANLMLDESGNLKLTDLGLAQIGDAAGTGEGGRHVVRGTPHYMSPEQVETPDDIDLRSDVFSLGATFYHLLRGRTPFLGVNKKELILNRLRYRATPLSKRVEGMPEQVSDLIAWMMEPRREDRPGSAQELFDALVAMEIDLTVAGDLVGGLSARSGRQKAPPGNKKTSQRKGRAKGGKPTDSEKVPSGRRGVPTSVRQRNRRSARSTSRFTSSMKNKPALLLGFGVGLFLMLVLLAVIYLAGGD